MGDDRPALVLRILAWGAASGVVLGVTLWIAGPLWPLTPLLAVTNIAVSVAFAGAAAILWGDPPQRSNARLFWLMTVAFTAGFAGTHPIGPLPAVEFLAPSIGLVALAAVLLRYPETRVERRSERVYLQVALVVPLALRLLQMVLMKPEWVAGRPIPYRPDAWWPTLLPAPSIADVIGTLYGAAGMLMAVAFVPLLVARLRRGGGIDRRVLQPVLVSALALGGAVACEAATLVVHDVVGLRRSVIVAECCAVLLIPLSFLSAAVRRRFTFAAVGDLVRRLTPPVTIDIVQDALRAALADPRLEIAFPLPREDGLFTADGRRFDPTAVSLVRTTHDVLASDRALLAVVTVDRSMRRYPELLEATLGAVALALENGLLHDELRAKILELQASRTRLVTASDDARSRIERDLHDGAQQRLLALKLTLGRAMLSVASASEREMIERTRHELAEVLSELRALARGIHPAVLTESGLRPALGTLAERLPIAVTLEVVDRRFGPATEAAAYFVACEAMANSIKHSAATSVAIRVSESRDGLLLHVADDGAGGAVEKSGGGLEGLRDRVDAAGGRMLLESPPGAGTRITVRLPRA